MSDTKSTPAPDSAHVSPRPAEVSRRDFLSEITVGALGVAGLGGAALTYQYFSPNVLFEPPMTFRAGNPDLYPENSVTFLQDQLVYIVRTSGGILCGIGRVHASRLHHSMEAGSGHDCLPVPREQISAGWEGNRRPGAAPATALFDQPGRRW